MIKRQRGDDTLFTVTQHLAVGRAGLLKIRLHVAMGQHRPFGHASGATGILQEGEIVIGDRRALIIERFADFQYVAK